MKGFILVLFFLSLPAQGLDKVNLSLALYTLEPLVEPSISTPKGIIGLALEAALLKRSDLTIKYADYSFARFMLMMKHAEHDLGLMVAKTPEREKVFRFTKDYLWISRPALIVKKVHPLAHVKRLSELEGKKIGHIRASIIPEELQKVAIDWNLRSESDYFGNAFKSLELDRLDAFFVPTAAFGRHKLLSLDQRQEYVVVMLPLEGLKLYGIYPRNLPADKARLIEEIVSEISKESLRQIESASY